MGHEFFLKKAEHAKLCRIRKRIEKFGLSPALVEMLTPSQSTVQFRCQSTNGDGVKKGDPVLIFTTGNDVQILKHNMPVGSMMPYAASDFGQNFSDKSCPEYQLGEIASDPSPLDGSFDVELRPPVKPLPKK